jgi:hypothetical protein
MNDTCACPSLSITATRKTYFIPLPQTGSCPSAGSSIRHRHASHVRPCYLFSSITATKNIASPGIILDVLASPCITGINHMHMGVCLRCILSSITLHHLASPRITLHHFASSCITFHHHASPSSTSLLPLLLNQLHQSHTSHTKFVNTQRVFPPLQDSIMMLAS